MERFTVVRELPMLVTHLFRARGQEGMEMAAFLAARPTPKPGVAQIDTLAIPKQVGEPVEFGCSLFIPGSEFTRLGRRVAQDQRFFCGQVHSHPGEAYHSPADDSNLFMRFHGAVSIVVPRFAADDVSFAARKTAVYRFDVEKPGWRQLTTRQAAKLFTLEEGEARVILE